MKWGDIVRVDLNPVVGSEADKVRPAVVVGNDGANQAAERWGRGVVTVAPITSNVSKVYPFQVLIAADHDMTGLSTESKIQVEQIRAVDVARIGRQLGRLPNSLHEPLRDALALHLGLKSSRAF
ncbi:type II toxin-antitoxin system PemK/MazF family toxin [Actinoplanes rectilineatus]|uniref:type II toxin-antitoxin system PemK/MazF family toxin n=1 Tax=Actinoplanes rectilineatus TaxID=113571 RepID=UPI0005F2B966|nr:type II toxin-antitoxin system PemK/MazF family toxin [Actinoplanes rectilineatus]